MGPDDEGDQCQIGCQCGKFEQPHARPVGQRKAENYGQSWRTQGKHLVNNLNEIEGKRKGKGKGKGKIILKIERKIESKIKNQKIKRDWIGP